MLCFVIVFSTFMSALPNRTPADCVSLALFGALFSWSTPILVISGINKGSSCGQKMFYSGAFAGAREALISGVPSLRISLNWKKDVSCETDLKDAANVCLPLIYAAVNDIEKGNFPKGCLLNVDIPSCPLTNKGNGHLHVLMSYESVLALGLLLMKFIFFAAACYESNIEALVVYEVRKIMEVIEMISTTFLLLGLALCLHVAECTPKTTPLDNIVFSALNCRKHSAVLTDFGGVGDGKTSNTKAFASAINKLSGLASDGGAMLIVPPGKWLTGSFNLTSHFTLYIHKDAVLLGSQDESEWPNIDVLPSYGREIDFPGGRRSSLIFGTNLTDVVVTGGNGTIDGQGANWWKKYRNKEFNVSRPFLIEIMYSNQVQISNLTLINSPSWNVHPIFSSDVVIQGMTILAPIDSPNTDGINPDSCTNIRIEDCYIVSGDDCIAVKSGWDRYGLKVGIPTQQLVIRRLTCISPDSATIALGSEMSGGIQDVRIEDITAINTESGVRIKTALGRGGFVRDIYVRRMIMKTMKYVFWMTGSYRLHPDPSFDPKALPEITRINYRDMVAENVTYAARLDGISNDPFTGICISNVTITLTEKPKKLIWNCTNVEGVTSNVTPPACDLLPEKKPIECPFPEDRLPIEDVKLKSCSTASTVA
ncbi:hypothetical protein LWI28_021052 [Acer negundo]|uniref:Survival protein SurE-like phosphatase/nucleotidase domain-containing protein n=2 Tax=Acer negundo TaxID=4023 RepID=A0AAD5IFG5_ACENE|nr:hypothetical protein LWI28_013463 [Acer negundo]KAI9161825.1 hypothetical protein LWI28_021052 [Acer negundo]